MSAQIVTIVARFATDADADHFMRLAGEVARALGELPLNKEKAAAKLRFHADYLDGGRRFPWTGPRR